MSKLSVIRNMNLKITWKLIYIGLYGYDVIQPILTDYDVFEYLDDLLTDVNNLTDDIISLVCLKDNKSEFRKFLQNLANHDESEMSIQVRKWKVLLLQELLNNISKEPLKGLLELMEFWFSIGVTNDCPFVFPDSKDSKAIQEYFSQSSYDIIVADNREWLEHEVQNLANS